MKQKEENKRYKYFNHIKKLAYWEKMSQGAVLKGPREALDFFEESRPVCGKRKVLFFLDKYF